MMPLRDCAECAMPWPARRDFQQAGPRTRNRKADPEPSEPASLGNARGFADMVFCTTYRDLRAPPP